jgi:hypothetical protein
MSLLNIGPGSIIKLVSRPCSLRPGRRRLKGGGRVILKSAGEDRGNGASVTLKKLELLARSIIRNIVRRRERLASGVISCILSRTGRRKRKRNTTLKL